jgi:hypothetical protein
VSYESQFSLGVAMSARKIGVISGNFVTAQPLGVLDGIDYQHTGKVRRIDNSAIDQQLEDSISTRTSPADSLTHCSAILSVMRNCWWNWGCTLSFSKR